jgi:hypothetical protein
MNLGIRDFSWIFPQLQTKLKRGSRANVDSVQAKAQKFPFLILDFAQKAL